jgi:glycosyltransferase involved in cell wall biosynthesis
MRILMVNTLYPPTQVGGAEKSVSLLAEALVRAGDDVSVITLHPGKDHITEERNGVRVHRIPLYNRYWPFNREEKPSATDRQQWHLRDMWNRDAARHVGKILDEEKPDVVHTNNIQGFSVAIWNEVKKRKIRLVHTLRDYYMLCHRCTVFHNGAICEKRCFECQALSINRKPASQKVDAVVSNSEYVLQKHKKHGFFSHTPTASVIYNISGAALVSEPSVRDPSDPTLVFGFIGKVGPEKGIEVLLAATKLLTRPNWRLRIAGAGFGSYVEQLKARYPDDRIEWLGFTASAEFYASIDVNIIPSIWAEPLSRTFIETFAAGKSAISAAAGGNPEIAHLGKVVETYPPQDEKALASIMDNAIADIERWRGSGGFIDAKAFEVFSEAAITGRYKAVYTGKQVSSST